MYLSKDTTNKSSKKLTYAILALVGVACIALGLSGTVTVEDDYNSEGLLSHLSTRQEYFASQAFAMEDLIKSGIQTRYDSHSTIESMLTSLAKPPSFKKETVPALRNGLK